jgi:transposase
MRPYSEDLRERVMAAIDRGDRREEVAERFSVSVPTITRWVRLRRETNGLAPRPVPGPPSVKLGALVDVLPKRLAERADATLEEQCTWWHERSGVVVSTATMSRGIARVGWTREESRWEPARGTRPPEQPGAMR